MSLTVCFLIAFVLWISLSSWFYLRLKFKSDKAMIKARFAGWRSCEGMVISRIKKHYPENSDAMIEKVLQ